MYGVSTKGIPSQFQAQYLTDPRLALAAELQKSGASTSPVQSPFEGIARALTGAMGGIQMGAIGDEYKQRGQDYATALTAAASDPRIQSGIPAWKDPSTGQQLVPAVAPGMDTYAAILNSGKNAENPDLQEYASQLQGKKMEEQMKMQNELDKERKIYTDPEILAGKAFLAKAGRSVTNVSMGQEKEEDKAVGKAFGEDYVNLQKAGREAPNKIAKYERLNQLLDGIETGTFKGTTTQLKAAAKGAGVDLEAMGVADDVAPIQAAQALSNSMALELRNPSGGAGMPGALSDSDREYLRSMTPGVQQTKEGRKLMSETATSLAKRDQEVAQLARNYRSKNGRLDEGFYDVLAQFSEANPLFKPRENKVPSPQVPGNRPPLSTFLKPKAP